MPRNVFSKENQPENRGRKPVTDLDKKHVNVSASVSRECAEWYRKRRGLSGMVLEMYYKEQIK